jgi:tRNA(adenine34) deaminase
MLTDLEYMALALAEARDAALRDEVPVGAVLVSLADGGVVARTGNATRAMADPTAHAEILAIRDRCAALGVQRIPGHVLFVTLEPCAMCAAALSFARIDRVVYGAADAKGGGVDHGGRFYTQPTCHHRPQVTSGVGAEDAAALLQGFFRARRARSVS